MINAVRTIELCKKIKKKEILKNINLTISEGKIYGLVGKNGAGKTTLMKLLCGILYPTSGDILLFNSSDLSKGRDKIGALIDEPALYPNMSGIENLIAHGILTSIDFNQKDIHELIEIVGLKGMERKKIKEYSLGMKQRLAIALTLLGKPKLLILDEPMNGLDPTGIKQIRELLLRINNEYKTSILISSHIIDELAKMVDDYGVIKDGNLIREITVSDFRQTARKTTLEIQVSNHDIEKISNLLNNKNIIEFQCKTNGYFVFDNYSEEKLRSVLQILIDNKISILRMTRNEHEIEDYIISLLEENVDETIIKGRDL